MIALSWSAGLPGSGIDEVRALAAAAAAVDGTPPLSEDVLLHLDVGDDRAVHLLGRDARGALVAFAHLDLLREPPSAAAELVVHPAHRRAGSGARVVRALLDRTDTAQGPGGGPLRVWAHGDHPGAVALAARLGFGRARELWQMRRSLLDPLPAPALPDGVRLRSFVVGQDEAEFVRVNNLAFAWHPEQGGWGVDQVTVREAEPWFDPAGFLLAVDGPAGDTLIGFHWTKVHGEIGTGDRPRGLGEIYVLGIDPAAGGRHLGTALSLAGLRHLRERGCAEAMLYVEADNAAAVRLYSRLGFSRWSTDVSYVR